MSDHWEPWGTPEPAGDWLWVLLLLIGVTAVCVGVLGLLMAFLSV